MESIQWLLDGLSLPGVGLPAIFVISFVAATLLPLGSEPVLFAYVSMAREMFWPAVLVASLGNTLGGMTSYAVGRGAKHAMSRLGDAEGSHTAVAKGPDEVGGRWHTWSSGWLTRVGPAALLLSWLPLVGDPLCAVAGYLRLPFWPCALFMAIGKFLRYSLITAGLLWGWSSLAG